MMSMEEASALTLEMVSAAATGRSEAAADMLVKLGEESDYPRMLGVCCGMAEAAAHCVRKVARWNGQPVPGEDPAAMVALEEVKPGATNMDPGEAFSVRFIAAWTNGDRDTCEALFAASWQADTDEHVGSVIALLANVAGIVKTVQAESDRRGEVR